MRTTLLICLHLALLALPARADAEPCQPATQLSARDVESIQTLARQLGMSGPLRLCNDYDALPSACEAVRVDSLPVASGNRRDWQRLYLRQPTQRRLICQHEQRVAGTRASGGWRATLRDLEHVTTWRFTNGRQHADVRLGDAVTYGLADQIIRALLDAPATGTLDAQGRELLARWQLEEYRLAHITSIYPYGNNGYEVRLGEAGGMLIHVVVQDSAVTVVRVSTYLI